jgi:hypothetical protein
MKLFAAFLVLLFLHSALAAQQLDAPSDHRAFAESPLGLGAVFFPSIDPARTVSLDQPPPASQKHQAKPARAAQPSKQLKRTRIDASMVGYIDDSAVQTLVRVRFDAGFNAPRPDRAEYFYAGSSTPAGSTDAVQRTLNFQQLYLLGEYAPLERLSAFVQVPFRWVQPSFIPSATQTPDLFSTGGISDVQAGLKFAAVASGSRRLTVQLGAYFPTGDGSAGLGTSHYSIEPKMLFFQRISVRTAVEAEAGDTHPISGTIYAPNTLPATPSHRFAGDVLMYGVGPSYQLVKRDRYGITPVLELVSWHVFGGLQTGSANVVQSAAGINVLNAKLGARTSFPGGSSIYAGFGRGLTSNIWYRNLFRIEYRHVF